VWYQFPDVSEEQLLENPTFNHEDVGSTFTRVVGVHYQTTPRLAAEDDILHIHRGVSSSCHVEQWFPIVALSSSMALFIVAQTKL
jgi:hypothetical protein